MDGDGDIEVAAASNDGFLYVWDLPGAYNPDNIAWGSYLRDGRHSGIQPAGATPSTPATNTVMPEKSVYNYPNPAPNPENIDPRLSNATAIRYFLNYEARVNVRIYDLSGELVGVLSKSSAGQTNDEIIWDISGVESGVYLARVEAASAGHPRSVAFIKIAVVK